MWYIWLGIVILLILIEYISTKTIWFALSGILAFLLSFLIDNFFLQFLIFLVGGLFLLTKYKNIVLNKEEEIIKKIFPKKGKKRERKSVKDKKNR